MLGPDIAKFAGLMTLTSGQPEVVVGLVDAPVQLSHPDLSDGLRLLTEDRTADVPSLARRHGTFIAGLLMARRDATVPGLCPDCTLLVRPLKKLSVTRDSAVALAKDELAEAITECVEHGATIINLSLSLSPAMRGEAAVVTDALQHAAARGVLVVAASGNERELGSSALTSHPWVIPVASLTATGLPSPFSSTSAAVSARGVSAPGENITGLDAEGGYVTLSGTSAAAAFVSGAAALLRSVFRRASPQHLRAAIAPPGGRQRLLFPPALDAWAAYERLLRA